MTACWRFSPASLRATRAAVGFADDHVSKVVVLVFSSREEGFAAATDAARDHARDDAFSIGEFALKSRVPCEMDVLHSTSPGEEIVAEARRRHCDLIWLPAPSETDNVDNALGAGIAVEVLGKVNIPVMLFRSHSVA